MCCGKKWRLLPTQVPSAPANVVNPGTTTGGTPSMAAPFDKLYIEISHIRVVNPTAVSQTISLWLGTTGVNADANSFAWQGEPVKAKGWVEWFGKLRLYSIDFIVHGSDGNNKLIIQMEGEIGIA